MAGGTRQTNTMGELLRKQLAQMNELKLAEDADFDFIAGMETAILQKLRAPIDQVAQQGLTGAPPQAAQGMPPMMDPAMMGGGAPMGPPPMPGGDPMAGGGMPMDGITPEMTAGMDPNQIADMLIAQFDAMGQGGGGGAPAGPMPPGAVPGAVPPGRGPAPSPPTAGAGDELRRVLNRPVNIQ